MNKQDIPGNQGDQWTLPTQADLQLLIRILRKRYLKRKKTRPGLAAYLVSYPKCGRTWLRMMIGEAIRTHFDLPEHDLLDLPELTRAAGLPAAGLTHDNADPWGAVRWDRMSRDKSVFRGKDVILLTRDPRDVVVSFYFHSVKRARSFNGSMSEFIRHPKRGIRKVLAFNNIWAENLHVPARVLCVTYEDLHAAPRSVLREALGFLGAADVPSHLVAEAVNASRIDRMRAMERQALVSGTVLRPGASDDFESFKVRRGKVGGYADYLGPSDLAYVEAVIAEMGDPFAAARPRTAAAE
jgi:hypothetical protein